MKMMEFSEWINRKFVEWRGPSRKTVTDFAEYIGVPQQTMTHWMTPKSAIPHAKNLKKLVARYGNEVYEVMGLQSPSDGVTIPLLGRIVAGEPIPLPPSDFSSFDPESQINVLRQWLPPNMATDNLFALEVEGDSMKDLGIDDRTTIVIQKTSIAENGDVVAVCFDDENAFTLKRFYRENGHIRLQPANKDMQPMIVDADQVHIVGKLIIAIRKFY